MYDSIDSVILFNSLYFMHFRKLSTLDSSNMTSVPLLEKSTSFPENTLVNTIFYNELLPVNCSTVKIHFTQTVFINALI